MFTDCVTRCLAIIIAITIFLTTTTKILSVFEQADYCSAPDIVIVVTVRCGALLLAYRSDYHLIFGISEDISTS
jgi:hypothetical protein